MDAFDKDKLTSWSNKPNYRADYHWQLHPANETSKQRIEKRDENFASCDEVRAGYVGCRECHPCEVEAAMYDSCGFMTGRTCVPVLINEDFITKECEVEGKNQEQGDPKCTHVVEKKYKHDDEKKECTNYECETIPAETCDAVFPRPTPMKCAQDQGLPAKCNDVFDVEKSEKTTCDVKCAHFECKKNVVLPICKHLDIQKRDSEVKFCEALSDEDECGERQCERDIELDQNKFEVVDGVIKCKENCMRAVPKTNPGSTKCATGLECMHIKEEDCDVPKIMCPGENDPYCYTKPEKVTKDECGCPVFHCKRPDEDPNTCGDITCRQGKVPTRSEIGEMCCNKPDICKCESGNGELCCNGDACDPHAECVSEDDCCPKDKHGCFIHGEACTLNSMADGSGKKIVKNGENCKCPVPFKPTPKPLPMCCAGFACNPTECKTLQQCCRKDECCAMYNAEVEEWQFVGEKCPPKCGSGEPPKGKSYIIHEEDSSVNACPDGKCCCTEDRQLVVKDCHKITTPGPFHNISTSTTPFGGPTTTPTGYISSSSSWSTSTGTYIITTTPPIGPKPPKCEALLDPYSKETCCRDCTIGNERCPDGKACCDDGGKLRIVGTHCCKGDGCCGIVGGQRDCCNDEASCCGTGCFEHCRIEGKDSKIDGFYDHYRKATKEEPCKCRQDATKEECENEVKEWLHEKYPENNKCLEHTEEECSPGCTRYVCKKKDVCSNTLRSYMRRYLRI